MNITPFHIWPISTAKWQAVSLLLLLFLLASQEITVAEEGSTASVSSLLQRAEEAWTDGANFQALEMLDQGLQDDPQSVPLLKLYADILSTSRRPQDAITTYEKVLQQTPKALNVRWAKWSVLLRSGKGNEAVDELRHIARQDPLNPLVHLRMAVELRKLDRLEDSVSAYQNALELASNLPSWRLALARAKFDILDYRGAHDEVQEVLKQVASGSPEEAAAQSLLSIVFGATKERGRRFQPIFSPEGTSAQRKEWAIIRADAWNLFESGRYHEAEPIYRRILELKPSDYRAIHELGSTLMELGRYEEAIAMLQRGIDTSTSDEVQADAMFRIGICLTNLERWSEALEYFDLLHDAALDFESRTKDNPIVPGTKVLDREKLEEWIAKVRPHVPGAKMPEVPTLDTIPPANPGAEEQMTVAEMAQKFLKPSDPITTRAALLGRDADFSLFRFVIPANRVMRDDLQGGTHEFIPINPGDTFFTTQKEIYLVFGLVTASYDEVPLTVECYLEREKISRQDKGLTRDQVILAMNDQSGYFVLSPPETGWKPGLHRCGIFVGGQVSAYTNTDEVRFRIIEPPHIS